MFSVTKTGMNFRPLWTAKVWPTNSGTMVGRRHQVLITFFWLVRNISSIFLARCLSTNGPFLIERAIFHLLAAHAGAARADDEFVGAFVLASGEPLRLLAPGRNGMGVTLARLSFPAAERGIDRIHRQSARRLAYTQPQP